MSGLQDHPRYTICTTAREDERGLHANANDRVRGRTVSIRLLERGAVAVSPTVRQEILNHRLVHHPNVCELFEVFLTATHLCIVTESCSGGDMFSYVVDNGRLSEERARRLFKQLICAIEHLHNLDLACRDIRLETVLLHSDAEGDEVVKIADLGTSKDLSAEVAKTRSTTAPDYMAPEVLKLGFNGSYDGRAADVWSAGVMLYTMLCGAYPFSGPDDDSTSEDAKTMRIITRIMSGELDFPEDLSGVCKDFVKGLLQQDAEKRMSLLDIHMHPWFKQGAPCSTAMLHTADAQRPPEHLLRQHEQQLEALLAEAATMLPYGAPPPPYRPVIMPQPAAQNDGAVSQAALPAPPPRRLLTQSCGRSRSSDYDLDEDEYPFQTARSAQGFGTSMSAQTFVPTKCAQGLGFSPRSSLVQQNKGTPAAAAAVDAEGFLAHRRPLSAQSSPAAGQVDETVFRSHSHPESAPKTCGMTEYSIPTPLPTDPRVLSGPHNWPRLYDDEGNIRRDSLQLDAEMREKLALTAAKASKKSGWSFSIKSAMRSVGRKK